MKIVLFSEKGGSGKSTLAVALASALHLPLVDLDPQEVSSGHLASRDTAQLGTGWIADLPAGLNLTLRSYINEADLIVIPVRPSWPDFKSLPFSLKFIEAHKGQHTKVAVFGSAINAKSSDLALFMEGVAPYGLPILGHFTQRVVYGRAGLTGRPFADLDKVAAEETKRTVTALHGLLGVTK